MVGQREGSLYIQDRSFRGEDYGIGKKDGWLGFYSEVLHSARIDPKAKEFFSIVERFPVLVAPEPPPELGLGEFKTVEEEDVRFKFSLAYSKRVEYLEPQRTEWSWLPFPVSNDQFEEFWVELQEFSPTYGEMKLTSKTDHRFFKLRYRRQGTHILAKGLSEPLQLLETRLKPAVLDFLRTKLLARAIDYSGEIGKEAFGELRLIKNPNRNILYGVDSVCDIQFSVHYEVEGGQINILYPNVGRGEVIQMIDHWFDRYFPAKHRVRVTTEFLEPMGFRGVPEGFR